MGKIERGEHVPTLPLILKIAGARDQRQRVDGGD
jgi:hypothetical protein